MVAAAGRGPGNSGCYSGMALLDVNTVERCSWRLWNPEMLAGPDPESLAG